MKTATLSLIGAIAIACAATQSARSAVTTDKSKASKPAKTMSIYNFKLQSLDGKKC
jgi:hypothetical protein